MENIIQSDRLSKNTIKVYKSHLRRLNRNQPILSLDFLRDYDSIQTILDFYPYNTRRGMISAIVVLLKEVIKRDSNYNYLYNIYKEMLSNHSSSGINAPVS